MVISRSSYIVRRVFILACQCSKWTKILNDSKDNEKKLPSSKDFSKKANKYIKLVLF